MVGQWAADCRATVQGLNPQLSWSVLNLVNKLMHRALAYVNSQVKFKIKKKCNKNVIVKNVSLPTIDAGLLVKINILNVNINDIIKGYWYLLYQCASILKAIQIFVMFKIYDSISRFRVLYCRLMSEKQFLLRSRKSTYTVNIVSLQIE